MGVSVGVRAGVKSMITNEEVPSYRVSMEILATGG